MAFFPSLLKLENRFRSAQEVDVEREKQTMSSRVLGALLKLKVAHNQRALNLIKLQKGLLKSKTSQKKISRR
jgi:hypothetical protein